MTLATGRKSFLLLIDTSADRSVIRKEEVPHSWQLIPGLPLLGVGGQWTSWETTSWLFWEDHDGYRDEVHPLMVSGLIANGAKIYLGKLRPLLLLIVKVLL